MFQSLSSWLNTHLDNAYDGRIPAAERDFLRRLIQLEKQRIKERNPIQLSLENAAEATLSASQASAIYYMLRDMRRSHPDSEIVESAFQRARIEFRSALAALVATTADLEKPIADL
jgi:hypothetical protein